MLVRRMVRPNDMREPIDTSHQPSTEPLVIQVVHRDNHGRRGWVAGREHRHHGLKHLGGRELHCTTLADGRARSLGAPTRPNERYVVARVGGTARERTSGALGIVRLLPSGGSNGRVRLYVPA